MRVDLGLPRRAVGRPGRVPAHRVVLRGAEVLLGKGLVSVPLDELRRGRRSGRRLPARPRLLLPSPELGSLQLLPAPARRASLLPLLLRLELRTQHRGRPLHVVSLGYHPPQIRAVGSDPRHLVGALVAPVPTIWLASVLLIGRRGRLVRAAVRRCARPVRLLQRDHDGVVPQDVRLVLPLGVVEDLPRERDSHLAHAGVDGSLLELFFQSVDRVSVRLERIGGGGRGIERRGRRGWLIGASARWRCRRVAAWFGVWPGHLGARGTI